CSKPRALACEPPDPHACCADENDPCCRCSPACARERRRVGDGPACPGWCGKLSRECKSGGCRMCLCSRCLAKMGAPAEPGKPTESDMSTETEMLLQHLAKFGPTEAARDLIGGIGTSCASF